ncbi:MAG: hypothetical protein LBB58_01235 [Cellulomonadaceae bacterium]|nr:hypothetical protein [Cellulomonadaceae bacterium]
MSKKRAPLAGVTITAREILFAAGLFALFLSAALAPFFFRSNSVALAAIALGSVALWAWLFLSLQRVRRDIRVVRDLQRNLATLVEDLSAQEISTIESQAAALVEVSEREAGKTVSESKRITDKFTQKTIGTVEREMDQLNQSLAGEIRLLREESLAAAASRVAILQELAQIKSALAAGSDHAA